MKLAALVLISGFLAVSTKAAGIPIAETSDIKAEVVVEEEISQKVPDDAALEVNSMATTSDSDILLPDETPPKIATDIAAATKAQTTGPQKNAGPEKPSGKKYIWSGQSSILDIIPYPMNVVLRTLSKDALKALDVESMCDTVQLIDWKNYKKLLEVEDFDGFKKKITNDEMLSAIAAVVKDSTSSYINKMITNLSKSIKVEDLNSLQNYVKEFVKIISLAGVQTDNGTNIQKNMQSFVENISIDKNIQKDVLENLQINVNKLLELLSSVKAKNSIEISNKSDLSGYDKGSPTA